MARKKQDLRTIYLSKRVYEELKKRKQKLGIPMAVQIERLLFGPS